MDTVIANAIEAIELRDWDRVKLLLHPYLHWTDASGSTTRGRTRVISALREGGVPAAPVSHELRDGQIYRWQEPTDTTVQ